LDGRGVADILGEEMEQFCKNCGHNVEIGEDAKIIRKTQHTMLAVVGGRAHVILLDPSPKTLEIFERRNLYGFESENHVPKVSELAEPEP
jgi:hypothetical protein